MKKIILLLLTLSILYISFNLLKKVNFHPTNKVGDVVDSFHDVKVYFNGGVGHTDGRNLASDGYNLGIKYQCVEFVKRYYYKALKHKMPDSYGNAIDFFDKKLKDGEINKQRNTIIQQNAGVFSKTRVVYKLKKIDNHYYLDNNVLGWLSKSENTEQK